MKPYFRLAIHCRFFVASFVDGFIRLPENRLQGFLRRSPRNPCTPFCTHPRTLDKAQDKACDKDFGETWRQGRGCCAKVSYSIQLAGKAGQRPH
jgi:hypothetical protein